MNRDRVDLAPDRPDVPSVWSVDKLVDLIDAAIDSAGAQLARSAGLWADSPSPYHERERPRRPRSLDSQGLLEQEDPIRDIGPV